MLRSQIWSCLTHSLVFAFGGTAQLNHFSCLSWAVPPMKRKSFWRIAAPGCITFQRCCTPNTYPHRRRFWILCHCVAIKSILMLVSSFRPKGARHKAAHHSLTTSLFITNQNAYFRLPCCQEIILNKNLVVMNHIAKYLLLFTACLLRCTDRPVTFSYMTKCTLISL